MRTLSVVLAILVVLVVGLAPLADAQAQNSRTVTGTVNFVNVNGQVVRMNPDGGGAEMRLITTGVPDATWKSLKKGDRITARVHDIPGRAPLVQVETIGTASAASSSSGGWQQIHGVVRDVQGSTLTLRADDGRHLTVDMAKVGTEIQKNLQRFVHVDLTMPGAWFNPNTWLTSQSLADLFLRLCEEIFISKNLATNHVQNVIRGTFLEVREFW